MHIALHFLSLLLRAGSGVVRIDSLFPGQMSYKATKPGSACHILACFILYCCLLGPLLCIISFRCYVFCLLVVLIKLSVLVKWLATKTPLRKPNRGEGIVSRKPRPKSAYDFLALLYYFIVLWCVCVVPQPYVIYFLLQWHDIAYLCWKCR